jgi:hypothetical protein
MANRAARALTVQLNSPPQIQRRRTDGQQGRLGFEYETKGTLGGASEPRHLHDATGSSG